MGQNRKKLFFEKCLQNNMMFNDLHCFHHSFEGLESEKYTVVRNSTKVYWAISLGFGEYY